MRIKALGVFIFLYYFVISLYGQNQVPEGSFENWTLSPQSTYEEPSGGWWTSLNALKNLGGPVTLEKTSDAHSGSYAARLETKQWGTFILPGLLASGRFVNNSPFVLQGQPFTDKPISFKGYYKYISVNSDSAAVFAMITKFNTVTGKRDTLAEVRLAVLYTINEYTLFDIPFNYYDSIATPDSIDVVFSSSAGGQNFQAQLGSTLFVDDVSLEYATGVEERLFSEMNVLLYPNPASDLIYIELDENIKNGTFSIISMDGKTICNLPINKNQITADVSQLAKGKYIINIYKENSLIASKKFEVIN